MVAIHFKNIWKHCLAKQNTPESDPSCGPLFCIFCLCVHELLRCSWFLIQYLSPSMDSPFFGWQFLCHGPVSSVQGTHGLRTASSPHFGVKWEAPRAGVLLLGWREGQAMPGNLKEVALYLEISLNQRQDIWVLIPSVWSPSCVSWNKWLLWVCFFLWKWEMVLDGVLWFLWQSLLLTLIPTPVGLPSPSILCPFLQWVSANPRKSLCISSLGQVVLSCHLRDLSSAYNVFLFTVPSNSYLSTLWASFSWPQARSVPQLYAPFHQSTPYSSPTHYLYDYQVNISLDRLSWWSLPTLIFIVSGITNQQGTEHRAVVLKLYFCPMHLRDYSTHPAWTLPIGQKHSYGGEEHKPGLNIFPAAC